MDPLTRRAFLHTSFAATALAPLLADEARRLSRRRLLAQQKTVVRDD